MKLSFNIGGFKFGMTAGGTSTSSSLYDGANGSRNQTTIPYYPGDTKRELTRFTRRELLRKARYFYANDGFSRGAIRDMARYSIGHGLTPQAQTENKEWNQAAEDFWEQWCKIADVAGRNHFNRLQRIISIAIDRDGDIGVLLTKTPTGFPQIQLIESHRFGSVGEDGSEWVDGVKTDEVNRALAYRVVVGREAFANKWVDVDAANMIFMFEPERADQFRGVTALHHAINTIHDKKDIVDFERSAVKNNSSIAAVLKTEDGSTEEEDWRDDDTTATTARSLTLAQMQSGQIPVIGKDEDIVLHSSDRPSPAFTGFLDFLIRDIATGMGLPYEFVWNAEKLGGTAQRFILEKAQRRFRERQELFKTMMLDRLWFWVISVAIKRGDLPAQAGAWRVTWQLPSELTVDAGRNAQQDREDLKMGLTTEARLCGMQGLDWETERDQRFREIDDLLTSARALAIKHGITTAAALQLLQQTTPNGLPTNEPEAKTADTTTTTTTNAKK